MPIREKELARLKVSGEDVYILQLREAGLVDVRRPVGGQDGIRHVVETFTLGELETPDEARTREMTERLSLQQKFASLTTTESPNAPPPTVQ